MSTLRLWIRQETRPDEYRAPITPPDARRLVADGISVTVEHSTHRIFPTAEYADAGCRIARPGSWVDAPIDAYVVGLKELPDEPPELRHRHVFFGHAYKGQRDAGRLLDRFAAGGGTLLDLEYLTDANGRRLAAFGFWAGYVGAALAVLHRNGRLRTPLGPSSKESLAAELAATRRVGAPRALVNGALGRCGRGARAALAAAGITPTCWDIEETREVARSAVLDHDIVLNAVLTTEPASPLLTPADLDGARARRLRVICDVTCDVGSPRNLLPIYHNTTNWARPARRLRYRPRALDIIAIDNLPSLLPREASTAFSADLVPLLKTLPGDAAPWRRCLAAFHRACASADIRREPTNV